MSYIISKNDPFISLKLTETGRQKLAQGELNFSFWAIGDSEINYDQVATDTSNPKILKPKDRQPDMRFFVSTGTTVLNPLTQANIKTIKAVINNEADERGFFTGTLLNGFTIATGDTFFISSDTIDIGNFTGGTQLEIGTGVTRNVGDYILIQLTNNTLSALTANSVIEPVPYLWYKIQDSSGEFITVDRDLPDMASSGTPIQIYIYPKGEVVDYYGLDKTSAYWETGTLSFNSSCDVSIADVPVWNMNIPFQETIAGITGTSHEGFTKYGSFNYIGTANPYLDYSVIGNLASTIDKCLGVSFPDAGQKSIAILHYTNNTISNFYGEFFHIDEDNGKTLKIHLPTIMWDRRVFTGSTTGDKIGMTFISDGELKKIENTDIEYHDLIEDSTLSIDSENLLVVGKIFPQLKIIIIDDEELVAAMSYKSNRNWTLPRIDGSLQNPVAGSGNGVLEAGKTIYLTYQLTNELGTGITSSLHCQKYAKITNETTTSKDIQFRLENTDQLPYMRKIEDISYDGMGFYASNFKLVYQIVDSTDERPSTDQWKTYDFTTDTLTTNSGETINPLQLEDQNPAANGFILTKAINTSATTYSIIDTLDVAPNSNSDILQFGDERFFFGNLETFIGATIFKTIFDIRINSGQFNITSNPTRESDSTEDIKISEVGIYDSNNELVLIGKLSQPVELGQAKTIMLELSIDF